MVRARLVDKQWISDVAECLLDALSPLLQPFLDGLNFSFERLRRPHQLDRLLWMLRVSEGNLPPEFCRRGNQFPHSLFGFLDLVDRPLGHKASAQNMISHQKKPSSPRRGFLRELGASSVWKARSPEAALHLPSV